MSRRTMNWRPTYCVSGQILQLEFDDFNLVLEWADDLAEVLGIQILEVNRVEDIWCVLSGLCGCT